MYKLFDPKIKVQKDRNILRITDMRLAKYSRRGLISNFLVYLLCMLISDLYSYSKHLIIVLTVGLLIITLIRAYFLFRFESIYPRGPARWRNYYFVSTLMGAFWWGVIMSSFTLTLGVDGVVPLLWVYTVVFFSTTAHAFAPYNRFLTIYQFLGIIPAVFCVFLIGEFIGVVYGLVLVTFCVVLNHQSQLISSAYWDKLEAEYELQIQREYMKEEKRDTQKTVQLSQEYMNLLGSQIYSLLNAKRGERHTDRPNKKSDKDAGSDNGEDNRQRRPKLELLYKNVSDFQHVLSKEVEFENRIFNARNLMQDVIARNIAMMDGRKVDIASLISPSMPVRVLGDADRINQIMSILLRLVATQSLPNTYVFVDVEFARNIGISGKLIVNISRQLSKSKMKLFGEQQKPIELSLDLALAKAIISQMGGVLEFGSGAKYSASCLRLEIELDIPSNGGQPDYQKVEFRNKKLLLMHPELRVLEGKQHELKALGFDVTIDKNYKSAAQKLEHELKQGRPYDAVIFYVTTYEDNALYVAKQMIDHPELRFSPQVIVGSSAVWKVPEWQEVLSHSLVTTINKPTGYLEFEMALKHVFALHKDSGVSHERNKVSGSNLLVYSRDKDSLLKELFKKLTFNVQVTSDDKHFMDVFNNDHDTMLLIGADDDGKFVNVIEGLRESNISPCIYPVVVVGSSGQSEMAYCNGADYFVDLSLSSHYIQYIIEHWIEFYRVNATIEVSG